MMRINRKTDYAIRVILTLAKRAPQERLSTLEIKNAVAAPHAFLQRIIADLSRAGLINTFPGPNGGIQLAHSPETLTLRHVWEAIEGPFLISDCIDQPSVCPLNPGCPVSSHWARLQEIVIREMESVSFRQLALEAGEISSQQMPSNRIGSEGVKI